MTLGGCLWVLTRVDHLDNLRTMPHAMPVEQPGTIHFVMDRGDRREDMFVEDVDRQDILKML